MKNLGGPTFYERDFRSQVFLRKYERGEEFTLTTGKNVVFIPDESVVKLVRAKKPTGTMRLIDAKGKNYTFSDLKATDEFVMPKVGPVQQNTTPVLHTLGTQIELAKASSAQPWIWVSVGPRNLQVSGIRPVKAHVKADYELLDPDGKPIAWISHKLSKKAKEFEVWSPLTKKNESLLWAHPEVQSFIYDVNNELPGGVPKRTAVFRKISDPKLRMKAIFGQKYGGPMGPDNVNLVVMGDFYLKATGSVKYELRGDWAMFTNGDIDATRVPSLTPVLFARSKYDITPVFQKAIRNSAVDNGVPNTRIVIAPKSGYTKAVELP